jgi:uncharacterized protein (TIGR02996 family)
MTTGEDLLRAIAESPEDDALRLVYADWQEERGDADRAAFIRAQIEHAKEAMPGWAPTEAAVRWRRLWQKNKTKWLAELPAWVRKGAPASFRRGLLEVVHCTAKNFIKSAEKLGPIAPAARRFTIDKVRGVVAELVACPALGRVSALELSSLELDGLAGVRTLVESPHLGRLRELTLRGIGSSHLGDPEAVSVIANAASLEGLASLSFPDEHLGPDEAEALGEAKGLAALTALSLEGSKLWAEGLRALASFHRLPQLRSLNLNQNSLGDEQAGVVAELPLGRLEWLDVGSVYGGIEEDGVAALAASPHLGHLRELVLSGQLPEFGGLRALLTSPRLRSLTRLHLTTCELEDDEVREMVRLPGAKRLTELHLWDNSLGDEGVKALASSPHLTKLEVLDLGNMDWGDEGALALAASPHLGHLRALCVAHTRVRARGRAALRERFGVVA